MTRYATTTTTSKSKTTTLNTWGCHPYITTRCSQDFYDITCVGIFYIRRGKMVWLLYIGD